MLQLLQDAVKARGSCSVATDRNVLAEAEARLATDVLLRMMIFTHVSSMDVWQLPAPFLLSFSVRGLRGLPQATTYMGRYLKYMLKCTFFSKDNVESLNLRAWVLE